MKLSLAAICLAALTPTAYGETLLPLEKGDKICLVGGGIGEGLSRTGDWEAMLHSRFPALGLRVRNLCYPGDEVVRRLRPNGFASPTDQLTREETSVVIGFFGFSESFAGQEGLVAFRENLNTWITTTLAAEYRGADKGNPRVALVTPAAAEPFLGGPDIKRLNTDLRLYAEAVRASAAKHSLPLVDLFAATEKAFAAGASLTTNGVSPTDEGYLRIAAAIDAGLFGRGGKAPAAAIVEEARYKSVLYRHRYRPNNGESVYGPRAASGFLPDRTVTSGAVADKELEIIDAMVTAADARLWALAGGDVANRSPVAAPAPVEIETNFGTGKNRGKEGSKTYLKPSQAKGRFRLAEGYAIDLFACELDFPELVNPTAFCFDAAGRMWVACAPSYPGFRPDPKTGALPDDKILVLTDRDRDGRADRCKVFADGLHLPTGLAVGDGGLYVAAAPDLLFLEDTDGDGVADQRQVLLTGFGTSNAHHGISSLTWGPAGWLYFGEGSFDQSGVETAWGTVRMKNAGVYRYHPRERKLQRFAAYNFVNPHGICFDGWGNAVLADAATGGLYFANPLSGAIADGDKHGPARPFAKARSNPITACEFVTGSHFPDAAQGDLLAGSCIAMLGALRFDMQYHDSDSFPRATEAAPIALSTDGNFRPVDLDFGPDGALYLCDWHNALLGHFEHPLRDPLRDRSHGRLWRVTYRGRALDTPPPIGEAKPGELIKLLAHQNPRVRTLAKLELRKLPAKPVLAAALKWGGSLDRTDPDYPRHLIEILNLHGHLATPNTSLLRGALRSKDPRARAAATRLLADWRAAEPGALAMLRVLAEDEDPRVRLEAVRACSFFDDPRALEVAALAASSPMDTPLQYCYDEAMKTLRKRFPEEEEETTTSP